LDFSIAVSPIGWVPVVDHAAAIARLGFSAVEVLKFPHWDADGCQSIREHLSAEGLAANSVHLPFGSDLNILSTDPGLRLHAMEAARAVIRGSAPLGASVLVLHPGREYRTDRPLAEIVAACQEALADLADLAGGLGLTVAVEQMLPAHVLCPPPLLREVVEGVGRANLGFCLDTGHANVGGHLDASLAAFAGRIFHVHIHDNHGSADEHLLPSLGTVQWGDLVDRLAAAGFDGPLTIECYPPDGVAPEEMLPRVRRALGVG
jgi:sugar phosphate isomerase/epimerase